MASAGSVYQRASDGRWVASIRIPSGKRVVRYADTKREAHHVLGELQRQHALGTLALPSRVTVGEWVQQWMERRSPDWRPTTIYTYTSALRHLTERIGHVRLDKVTPALLADTFSRLRRADVGTKVIERAYTTLRSALDEAVQLGILTANPITRVPKPAHAPKTKVRWTAEEARQFLAVALASPRRYAPALVLMLGTGLRRGEVLGLSWSALDEVQHSLVVRQALVYVGGKHPHIGPPKTTMGNRAITFPTFCLDALRGMPRPIDAGLPVFVTESGRTPHPCTLRQTMRALCKDACVPVVPLHSLRHAHAALLIGNGTDIHTVQRRLGHSRASVTLNTYSYALNPDETAATTIGRVLREGAG